MKQKVPVSDAQWPAQLENAVSLVRSGRTFLFSADIDKDSLGSMISLALYLRLLKKNVYLVIPIPLGDHLDYLRKIISYNSLPVVRNREDLLDILEKIDTVVFCDTASPKLIPFYLPISEAMKRRSLSTLEIDHHFGTDSEQLAPCGVNLFRQCNAATELTAELLARLFEKSPGAPNPFDHRNIVISLITGLFGDTVGGTVIPYQESYSHWMNNLNRYLVEETRLEKTAGDPGGNTGETKFGSVGEIQNHLNSLSDEQEVCLLALKKRMIKIDGLGFLNLLDSTYPQVQEFCKPYHSPWFADFLGILLNVVPEEAGKIGLICYNGKNAEEKDCIFIKIRRSANYSGIDLRTLEEDIRYHYGDRYMGGGGHPGAASFRIHPQDEEEFLEKLNAIIAQLIKHIR